MAVSYRVQWSVEPQDDSSSIAELSLSANTSSALRPTATAKVVSYVHGARFGLCAVNQRWMIRVMFESEGSASGKTNQALHSVFVAVRTEKNFLASFLTGRKIQASLDDSQPSGRTFVTPHHNANKIVPDGGAASAFENVWCNRSRLISLRNSFFSSFQLGVDAPRLFFYCIVSGPRE